MPDPTHAPDPELAARRVASDALLRDFERAAADGLNTGPQPDWANWAHRLAVEVRRLLEVTAPAATGTAPVPPTASYVRADRVAVLTAADTVTALQALDDAQRYRGRMRDADSRRAAVRFGSLAFRWVTTSRPG